MFLFNKVIVIALWFTVTDGEVTETTKSGDQELEVSDDISQEDSSP